MVADATARYASYLHELDAWTEYWDIYHPETDGRFYFGNGKDQEGLLARFLPRDRKPAAFLAWTRLALAIGSSQEFLEQIQLPDTASAVMEVDALVSDIFHQHFGQPSSDDVRLDYLECMIRCGTDTLPPATSRDIRIPPDDWRKSTAGRNMIDSDLMWFAWALQLEAVHALAHQDDQHSRRALQLAGVIAGCSANFAWRGHRRTRPEYHKDDATLELLRRRGMQWAEDSELGLQEVHALYRIREWGHDD